MFPFLNRLSRGRDPIKTHARTARPTARTATRSRRLGLEALEERVVLSPQQIFYIGANGGLYTAAGTFGPGAFDSGNATWEGPTAIGPAGLAPSGATITSLSRGPAENDLFFIGNNGALYTASQVNNGNWTAPQAISATGLAAPGSSVTAPVRSTLEEDVFFVGSNGTLYTTWQSNGGMWNQPLALSASGQFPSGAKIAAQMRTSTMEDVFVVGNNGALFETQVNSQATSNYNAPQAITPAGLAPAGASITLLMPNSNREDIFFVGNDGALQTTWEVNNGSFNTPQSITAGGFAPAGASVVGLMPDGVEEDLFVVGNNGALYTTSEVHNNHFSTPQVVVPSGTVHAGASLTGVFTNWENLYFVGSDGTLYTINNWGDWGDNSWNPLLAIGSSGSAAAGASIGALPMLSAISEEYWALKGPAGVLGEPTTGEIAAPDGSGSYELFQGGGIYDSGSTGPHEVHGAFFSDYASLGAEMSVLGYPTSDVTDLGGGVQRCLFQNGVMFWTQATGAHEMHTPITGDWVSNFGVLGYPTSDVMSVSGVSGALMSTFQNGAIYWSPSTGAHDVYGAIGAEYAATANETDSTGGIVQLYIGLPTSDEMNVPGVSGARMNTFQSGAIYWSPSTGAHVVYGAIGAEYASLGGPTSALGLPTSDEQGTSGGRVSYFQNGKIMWTPQDGAHPFGPATHFVVSAPTTVGVNMPFSVTITAKDAFGNTATDYSGLAIILESSPGDSELAYPLLTNGTGTGSFTFQTAGTFTLLAYRDSLQGTSNSITVLPDWFSYYIPDQTLQTLARSDYQRDGVLTFTDWMNLFNTAAQEANDADPNDETLATNLTSSLQRLVANIGGAMNTIPYVVNLANQVLIPSEADVVNLESRGLLPYHAGETGLQFLAIHLPALVSEWFLGAVHPTLADGSLGDYSPVNLGLFSATSPDPSVGTPTFKDVFQGGLGDCTLIASTAEVAGVDPSIIQSMFIYDGTFAENTDTVNVWTVRFYNNGQPQYVTVDNELPNGGTLYDHPENNLWAALVEKAYAQENLGGWLATHQPGVYSYAGMSDGDRYTAQGALGAITGFGSDQFLFGYIGATHAGDIANILKGGGLVVLCTDSPSNNNLVHNHCYAVLSYDPGQDQFTLLNPWGWTASGEEPGTFYFSYFTANGDYLDHNFVDGADAGASPSQQVAFPTLSPLTPDDSFSFGHEGGEGLLPPRQAFLPLIAVSAQGQGTARQTNLSPVPIGSTDGRPVDPSHYKSMVDRCMAQFRQCSQLAGGDFDALQDLVGQYRGSLDSLTLEG